MKKLVAMVCALALMVSGAAVICESGFLSHPQEETLLTDNKYQWDLAWAIFSGIAAYLGEAS